MRSGRYISLLAISILAIDQGSKWLAHRSLISEDGSYREVKVVGNLLTLHVAYNSGAAFSLATGQTLLLSIFSIAVAVAILVKSRRYTSRIWQIAAALIVGGIAGNICDRLFRSPGALRGPVLDWIHITHWPTFNIADSSIVLGAALAVAAIARNITPDEARR